MLGLREYSLACPALGGVRCVKPSEHLLTCVFTNAEGTFPTCAIAEAEGILSSHGRAVCNAKPTSAPDSSIQIEGKGWTTSSPNTCGCVAGQTCALSLQPQQLPPAQPLQEGCYTQHEDNATLADVLLVTPAHPEPHPRPLPQPHQPRVHQQQLQPQPAPAKNKPWGKQHRMSYAAATAADKAAIANRIIGISNRDMAPQLQREPVIYKSLYVNSYFVNHGAFRANPYSGLKQYLYGKGVPQTIREVSFVGKGWTLAEVFIAEKDWVQAVEVCRQYKLLCEEDMMQPPDTSPINLQMLPRPSSLPDTASCFLRQSRSQFECWQK
ncbi:hypothetical protein BC830DRAFT_1219900 [Chytriomyces sp. MP71]|nr:hypothetical protein BC830DRAFT_1219900 [Chytriomyces sp. MP71]